MPLRDSLRQKVIIGNRRGREEAKGEGMRKEGDDNKKSWQGGDGTAIVTGK